MEIKIDEITKTLTAVKAVPPVDADGELKFVQLPEDVEGIEESDPVTVH